MHLAFGFTTFAENLPRICREFANSMAPGGTLPPLSHIISATVTKFKRIAMEKKLQGVAPLAAKNIIYERTEKIQ